LLYAKAHEAILRIATEPGPETAWRAELQAAVDQFSADLAGMSAAKASHIRDELCTQLEHEAIVASNQTYRSILLTALKMLEALPITGDGPSR
jgi:hypothetical protein